MKIDYKSLMLKNAFNPHGVPEGTPDLYAVIRVSGRLEQEQQKGVVLPHQSKRFIRYDIKGSREFEFVEKHRNGYTCAFPTMPWHSFSKFWGEDVHEDGTEMYRIRLKSPDQIFVVDEQPFLDAREAMKEYKKNRKYTDRDTTSIYAAIAQTFTSLTQYKQDFLRPIYLIGRDLHADEASFYEPTFKRELVQKELARRAAIERNQSGFIKELFADKKPEQPAPKPSHLRLVR